MLEQQTGYWRARWVALSHSHHCEELLCETWLRQVLRTVGLMFNQDSKVRREVFIARECISCLFDGFQYVFEYSIGSSMKDGIIDVEAQKAVISDEEAWVVFGTYEVQILLLTVTFFRYHKLAARWSPYSEVVIFITKSLRCGFTFT